MGLIPPYRVGGARHGVRVGARHELLHRGVAAHVEIDSKIEGTS